MKYKPCCRSITTASTGTPVRDLSGPGRVRANGLPWPRESYARSKTSDSSTRSRSAGTTTSTAATGRRRGVKPGDIRSIDDIAKLPSYTSDDVKDRSGRASAFRPFSRCWARALKATPLKVQTSGGTTGKPRATLYCPWEWEMNGLTQARAMYIQGVRPGDVVQIPATCSLANLGWCVYKACHDYLGVLPLTTGSGDRHLFTPPTRTCVRLGHQCLVQLSRISDAACEGLPRRTQARHPRAQD